MCDDPVVRYLADLGFNVLRLPCSDIRPGTLLAGKGPELHRVGELARVWKSRRDPPQPLPKSRTALLAGKRTHDFDAKTGLSIAELILAPVGLDTAKLRAAVHSAKHFEFSFGDPEIWRIDPIEMGAFLSDGSLDETNPVVDHFIARDNPPVHILTDLLLSASVYIQLSNKKGGGLDLDLEAIQSSVGATVKLESKSEDSTKLLFQGNAPLTFGFRALKLTYENGDWKVHGFARPGTIFHANPPHPLTWASMFPLGEVAIVRTTN